MKAIKTLAYILSLALLASCHGFVDPNDLIADEPQAPYTLSVDKDVIESDGTDVATLTITDVNGLVLTEGEYLRNTSFYIEELDEWRSGLGSDEAPNLFTSIADGTYTISAMYKGEYCRNTVTVTSGNRAGYETFHKNVAIYRLTGTWCQYCPYMTEALNNVDEYTKDHSVILEFHNADEFSIQYSSSMDMAAMLLNRFGTQDDGYPYCIYSLAEGSGKRTVNDIQRFVKNQLVANPAKTGIKAESVVENGKVSVKATVKASASGKYDLGIAVLKDNCRPTSPGAHEDVYNDVVMMISGNLYAMSNEAFDLSAGEEFEIEKLCEHPDIYPGSSCRIVLFTLTEAGGKTVIDNTVTFSVGDSVDYRYIDSPDSEPKPENPSVRREQKMVAMQFTSIGCTYCPILSAALKDVQENYPDKIIPVSFHMDYSGFEDPMTLPVNTKFFEKVNTGDGAGLPLFALNFRKSSKHIINEYAKIVSEIEYQSEEYPAVGGVDVSCSYDAGTGKVEVAAKFVSDVAEDFRYHIFLVEDGIHYSQAGADGDYVHDNVFRAMAGDNLLGVKLNQGKALKVGTEYTVKETFTLEKDWKPENMRVVAMLLRSEDDGESYCCNNADQCAVVEASYDGREFFRHVCVMEFTGSWCAQCPDGATVLNYLVDRQYEGQVFALAFHNNDIYALEQEQDLYKMFNWSGYPAYVTDMRDTGLLNEGGCDDSIEKSLNESPTYCSVAVESSYDAQTGQAVLKARILSKKAMNYRIAAYVVEDKIKGEQTLGTGQVKKDYTHRHVVRKMLSSNVRGDNMGEIKAGKESSKTFTFEVDENWNLGNLSVAVLAIDNNGHVNNMAVCELDGGKMDHEYVQ